MLTKLSFFLLLFGFHFPIFSVLPKLDIQTIYLGQTPIQIRHENYGPGKVYVHLHANETTALLAAREVARQYGGQVITLVHQKERDIGFIYRKHRYTFDPNRIFTPQGVRHTLIKHHCYDPRVIPMIKHFAEVLLKTIPTKQKVVAVHNNKEYSLRDYFPKHELAHDALSYYYKTKSNYRNFYLVTTNEDFKRFKTFGFNVVEQAKVARDDGSLSIAMANNDYVNVEAGFGQLQFQKKMLQKA